MATAKASLTAMRGQAAVKTILAIAVAPEETLAAINQYADQVVCLHRARDFRGVGSFYE
ncbi:hypothetical protein [Rhizobium sp. IBUN]|uniref:hypothetical protein n=1 Tax=Rhizobium sp. IBUN TaxID=1042326 RepID=UPI0012EB2EA3|nr:hypothetical protein [Rhizobium sp. IBUN]